MRDLPIRRTSSGKMISRWGGVIRRKNIAAMTARSSRVAVPSCSSKNPRRPRKGTPSRSFRADTSAQFPGEISGLLGTYMDITGRKRLEAQLLQSQENGNRRQTDGWHRARVQQHPDDHHRHSEFLLNDLPAESPRPITRPKSAKPPARAAMLTRNSWPYGRKQFLQPKPSISTRSSRTWKACSKSHGEDVDYADRPRSRSASGAGDAGQD